MSGLLAPVESSNGSSPVVSVGVLELRATKIMLDKVDVAAWAADGSVSGNSKAAVERREGPVALRDRLVGCGDAETLSRWAQKLLDFVAQDDVEADAAAFVWSTYDGVIAALSGLESSGN